MFLKESVSNGRTFLSFVQGYRIGGKVKHKTLEKIGYLDELQKEYNDPIAHFKSLAKERGLSDAVERTIEIDITKRLPDNTSSRKNLGYAIPKGIYSLLGIHTFFAKQTKTFKY